MTAFDRPRSPRYEMALRYAEAGIAIFPCIPNTKHPAVRDWERTASSDIADIEKWWGCEDYNIGLPVGRAGWFVVDLDDKDGKEGSKTWASLCHEHGAAPQTYTVRTTSGGLHLYFRATLRNTASKLGNGIDTRGGGGYVLAPSSVIDGREYEVIDDADIAPLPEWVVRLLAQTTRARTTGGTGLDTAVNIDKARRYLHECIRTANVAIEGQGGDQHTYDLCAEVLQIGLYPETLLEILMEPDGWNDHCVPPWEEDDLREKCENAWKYMQNEPGSWGNLSDEWQALSDEYAAMEPQTTSKSGDLQDRRPWPVIRTARALVGMNFSPPEWVWQDRLVANKPNLYTGLPGVGKTTLAQNLAVAVAAGIPLLGRDTMQQDVFLLVGEDEYGPVRDNLSAIRQTLGVPEEALDRIHVLSTLSEEIPGGHRLATISDDGQVADTPFMREYLAPWLASIPGPVLFVIDPLAEFVSFNRMLEEPPRALATTWLRAIIRIGNVTPLVDDHPSKASVESGAHYAGNVQLQASFALHATLIGHEWTGVDVKQRKLTFKVQKARYAAEDEVEFYRTNQGPAFLLDGAPGHTMKDIQYAIFRHIAERADRGLLTGRDDRADYGPSDVGQDLGLDPRDVSRAMRMLEQDGRLQWNKQTGGGGRDRTPAGYRIREGMLAPPPVEDEY